MKTYSENTIKNKNKNSKHYVGFPAEKKKIIILSLTSERINDKTTIAVKGLKKK